MRQYSAPTTRAEVIAFYDAKEQSARQYATKEGRVLMVGGRPLKDEIDSIKQAKKAALAFARKAEVKEAVINEVNSKGVILARVPSTDPNKPTIKYLLSYKPEDRSVYCTCESFKFKNPSLMSPIPANRKFPTIDQEFALCKHALEWRDELLLTANEGPFYQPDSTLGSNASMTKRETK